MADINEIISQKAIDGIIKTDEVLIKSNDTLKEFIKSIAQLNETFGKASATQENVVKLQKESRRVTDEATKAKRELQRAEEKQRKEQEKITEALNREVKSLKDLQDRTSALIKVRKDINRTTAEGAKEYKRLTEEIRKNNSELKEQDKQIGYNYKNVGNYRSALDGVGKSLLAWGSGLVTVQAAISAFNAVIESSDALSDRWNETLTGLKFTLQGVARAVGQGKFFDAASMAKNFSTGSAYAQMLDRVEEKTLALSTAQAELTNQIAVQELLFKNKSLTDEQRLAAEAAMLSLRKQLLETEKQIAKEKLSAELFVATQASGMSADDVLNAVRAGASESEKFSLVTMSMRENIANAYNAVLEAGTAFTTFETSLLRTHNAIVGVNKDFKDLGDASKAFTDAFEDDTAEWTAGALAFINAEIEAEKNKVATIDQLESELTEKFAEENRKRLSDVEAANNKEIDLQEQKKEEIINKVQQAINAISALGDTYFTIRETQLSNEEARIAQQKAFELKLAGDNQAKINEINTKYAKKEADLKTKQAKQDRAAAIFRAIINVAQGVTAALGQMPPLSYIMAALTAGLGAVQIGVISSQPIPKFAKGTQRAPGGWLMAGEAGRELIEKDGRVSMVNKPTLLSGLRGAKIYSNAETEKMLKARPVGERLTGVLNERFSSLEETIRNKREIHINRHRQEVTEREGNYFKTYKARIF